MSLSKLLITLLLLTLLVLHHVQAFQINQVNSNPVSKDAYNDQKMDCGAACAARCQLASRQKLRKRACGTCCTRCKCVPPGTSGNHEVCPCYANMTTHGNRRKCP